MNKKGHLCQRGELTADKAKVLLFTYIWLSLATLFASRCQTSKPRTRRKGNRCRRGELADIPRQRGHRQVVEDEVLLCVYIWLSLTRLFAHLDVKYRYLMVMPASVSILDGEQQEGKADASSPATPTGLVQAGSPAPTCQHS